LPFHLPSPSKPLSPPLITLQEVSVGYDEKSILRRLSLNISDDDRIGLLGANGNGKSTFAKLICGRLIAQEGHITRASRLEIGFFAQHQLDELDPARTPYHYVADRMPEGTEAKFRARCAQLGFPNVKADTKTAHLSGGEKARLLLGLASFDGPHLLILDEPTNHLDIDSRAALIEAINAYEGAVILVSHDKYLLEACADRLWLVENQTVMPFDGTIEDYNKYILERSADADGKKPSKLQSEPREELRERQNLAQINKRLNAIEDKLRKYHGLIERIDATLADPSTFTKEPAKAAQLSAQRGELERLLMAAEEEWLALAEASAANQPRVSPI